MGEGMKAGGATFASDLAEDLSTEPIMHLLITYSFLSITPDYVKLTAAMAFEVAWIL